MNRIINILHILMSIFLVLLTTGCFKEDWYDIKYDKQQSVPANIVDLKALLDNATLFNTNCPASIENSADAHFFSNEVAEVLTGFERNSYTWSKEQPSIRMPDWLNGRYGSYRKIYTANLILESVDKIIPVGNSEIQECRNIKGQALFFRAKTFFELAMTFAPPYESSNANKKFGIPLRLESDVAVVSKRSTIEETYAQILNDLKESIDLLPNFQQYKTRPSKISVYALLARIYLSMENYGESQKYAGLALTGYNTLIDYNTLEINDNFNPFIGYNSEIIFYSYISGAEYFYLAGIYINDDLYQEYEEDDLRKKIFYNYDSGTGLTTFKGTYSGRGFDYFFNGLATDELYLIRAECYARDGKILEAMKDLNLLLRSRWHGSYTDITASNAEEALTIILTERKKELVLRGVRWSDLRRLNKDVRFVKTFSRTVGGKIYRLEPNSYQYTLPIPDDIIDATGMEQNPGWH